MEDLRNGYQEHMPQFSQHAPGGTLVYYADGDEEIIHVNQHLIDLMECRSLDEFLEHTGGSFRRFVYEEDIDAVEESIWEQVARQGGFDRITYRIKTRTGRIVSVEDFGKLVHNVDDRPVFYVFVSELLQQGPVDALTGLPSAERFQKVAAIGAQAIFDRGERVVAIAFNLMGMKTFNNRNGRGEGDRLLCSFANALRKHFGADSCSRFAEDRFFAFASDAEVEEQLSALFEDFHAANDGNSLPVRVGAYVCNPSDDINSVGFERATVACDSDRKSWHSHVEWFDDRMRVEEDMRMHVLGNMEQAIREGWIRPFYQAIVRSATSDVCGEEALARWIDPKYGMLSPAQFIPVLEEAGLLHQLDMHMVDCVLADMNTKCELGVEIVPVSVNISLRDLGSIDLANEVSKKADAAGISHDLLRIEFTESAASSDAELFRTQVKALHRAGFEVWMDDFGSGYSSLNSLKDFDFDLVKLDMGFISGTNIERARDIIAGVIGMASKIGISTLAEGVETEEQAVYLEDAGCDMLQGYYYTAPQSLETVIERFTRGTGMRRERIQEASYWSSIGRFSLSEAAIDVDAQTNEGASLSDYPAGVMESRDGNWRVLRANYALRKFFDKVGILSLDQSTLEAHLVERSLDDEFIEAARQTRNSGSWTRIQSRYEHESRCQFYTRRIASSLTADAFAIASIPTMLDTGLGVYGDVPVSYAVIRVILDENDGDVADVEYVHANPGYCEWLGFNEGELSGKSFIEAIGKPDQKWFDLCYHSAVLGERIQQTVYSDEFNHWIRFMLIPSPVRHCCIFAFLIVDEEQQERHEMEVGRDTSEVIIGITNVFNREQNFTAAMNGVLTMISRIVNPERLLVFERGEHSTSCTFEWCAEGAPSRKAYLQNIPNEQFEKMGTIGERDDNYIAAKGEELTAAGGRIGKSLNESGIDRMISVALVNDGKEIGYLSASNFVVEEGYDVKRLLETIGSFISTRIVYQRLVTELERLSTHDGLTGLLNHRGTDDEINAHLASDQQAPYTLVLMDIDDFKNINDLYGHEVGDAALQAISRHIESSFPEDAVIGRIGGDEFLVMLFGKSASDVDSLLEAFTTSDLSCMHQGKRYALSISAGYAEYPKQATNLQDIYTKADTALYAVKLAGKSGCRRYAPELDLQDRSALGNRLPRR